MTRDYHRWYSRSLNRDMELLVFGHGGMPYIVFPSSMGAFFEFEDRGMVQAVAEKLDRGWLQLVCVSSVDSESVERCVAGAVRRWTFPPPRGGSVVVSWPTTV